MPADSFTEVTHESWFSRIGGAITGVLVGVILFAGAFPLLFWNEGRAVKRYKTLKEGSGAVISVPADKVDSANAGKLIHVTGTADTDATLSDPVFGATANAIKLNRSVSMYQWDEDKKTKSRKKLGGGKKRVTTYTYNKTWSDDLIDSGQFKKPAGHQNPSSMPYESTEWLAENVSFGAFSLSRSLIGKIDNYQALPIASDAELADELRGKAVHHNSGFYIGDAPGSPEIGDCRVSFRIVEPGPVSVIAKQVEETFEPYQTEAGGTIELLQTGTVSADAMFEQAQRENKILTWVLRLVGFILMFVGLTLVFKPLSVLADVVPLFGTIVGAGTGIISFLLAMILSLLTVAIAWLFYRPLLGVALIAAAVVLCAAAGGKLRSASRARP